MRDFFKYWSNNKWKPDKSLVKWCDLIWQLYASHDTAAYMDIANSEYVKVYFLKIKKSVFFSHFSPFSGSRFEKWVSAGKKGHVMSPAAWTKFELIYPL